MLTCLNPRKIYALWVELLPYGTWGHSLSLLFVEMQRNTQRYQEGR